MSSTNNMSNMCFKKEYIYQQKSSTCGVYEWEPVFRNSSFFMTSAIIIGALIKDLFERFLFLYILTVISLGAIYGLIFLYIFELKEEIYNLWSKFISDYFFMPLIIYNLAVSINLNRFHQNLIQYVVLSLIRFGAIFGIITIFVEYYFTDIENGWFTSTWMGITLTMISSKAVIKELEAHGSTDNLISTVSAEFLLSIIISLIAYNLRLKIEYEVINVFEIIKIIIGHILSPILGYIIGMINMYCLKSVFKDKIESVFLLILCIFGSGILIDYLPGFSKYLYIASFAIYINLNKASIERLLQEGNNRIEIFFKDICVILESVQLMMEIVLLSYTGFTTIQLLIFSSNIRPTVISEIFFIYVILIIIRFIVIFVSYPILMKCGCDLNWKNNIILICGPVRNEICLSLIFGLFTEQKRDEDYYHIYSKVSNDFDKPLVIIIALVLLTHLSNEKIIQFLIRYLGITQREDSFMTCLIQKLNDFTLHSINKLKENVLFASADWEWVTKHTMINDEDEKEFNTTNPVEETAETPCILCKRKFYKVKEEFIPEKESEFKVNQSYNKAIHIAEMSYHQRFKKGLIGKIGFNFLTSFCQTTLDKTGQYLDVKLLKARIGVHILYLKLIEFLNVLVKKVFGKRKPQYKENVRYLRINNPYFSTSKYNLLQRFAAKIITCRYFKVVPFLSIIGNLCLLSLLNAQDSHNFIFFFFHIIFNLIFVLEICMKIVACGFKTFWKNFWDKFDFIFFIFTIIQFLILFYEMVFLDYSFPKIGFISFLYIYLGRILCIFQLSTMLQEKLENHLQEINNSYWYSNFDIAQAFFWSQNDVKTNLDYIIKNDKIFNEIKNKCNLNKQEILKEMALIQQQHPEPVIAVKTLITSRKILNDAKKTLQEMKNIMITDEDFTVLQTQFDKLIQKLNKIQENIPLILRHVRVMNSVEWMTSSIYQRLYEHIEFKNFKSGEVICEINQAFTGIYIIVSGLVKIIGTPINIKNSILPNTDSYLYFSEVEEFYDFVSTAQCLGLLGILTQTPFCTSAICETKVETIFISSKIMLEIMETSKTVPSILYQIWKIISFHIAVPILKQQWHYSEYSEEYIKILTNASVIPNLEDIVEYKRPQEVKDIILIQGFIKNEQTGEYFFGPSYIPPFVRLLGFMPKETRKGRLITLFYLTEDFALPDNIMWDVKGKKTP